VLLESQSILNKSMMKSAVDFVSNRRFKDKNDLNSFKTKMKMQNQIVQQYFDNDFRASLEEFRKSNNPDINIANFNDAIRNIEILTSPKSYIEKLKKKCFTIEE
jgi:hypothetical protein